MRFSRVTTTEKKKKKNGLGTLWNNTAILLREPKLELKQFFHFCECHFSIVLLLITEMKEVLGQSTLWNRYTINMHFTRA